MPADAMITLLIGPEEFDRDSCEVAGDAYRHLFRARRLARGDRLRVVDGDGRARWAEVARVDRTRAELAFGAPAPANEPSYRLELWVAAPRSQRAAWLVEKATEIGVDAISFVATRRGPRTYGPAGLERLRRVAEAAVEQSHRSRRPGVSGVEPWAAMVSALGRCGDADRFYLDAGAPSGDLGPRHGRGIVVVGPEGGFSDDETAELESLGCRAVSLGPRILRIETAAVAAAARLLLDPRLC